MGRGSLVPRPNTAKIAVLGLGTRLGRGAVGKLYMATKPTSSTCQ